ncbi:hypothetical protein DEO72_LG11g1972 [Vigna unguiculata]|uniref:Uncharacterized protein n=1 Tax=Vigna unguiculata TaxID=3917 RepID=A0A4D6NQM2_VIGUN|nr:hypothetical protein DEO72_LG11g1972 [Vigna unguiculata]
MSQDYHNRRLNTEKGNLSRLIHTSHNSHTHTSNTCQSEPQLKDFSCSFAIPSQNSREFIPSHNSRNATCFTLYLEPQLKGYRSEPQLKEHSNKSIFEAKPRPNHLADIANRQAPSASKVSDPDVISWQNEFHCQAPRATTATEIVAIAWRFSLYCQALHQ